MLRGWHAWEQSLALLVILQSLSPSIGARGLLYALFPDMVEM